MTKMYTVAAGSLIPVALACPLALPQCHGRPSGQRHRRRWWRTSAPWIMPR